MNRNSGGMELKEKEVRLQDLFFARTMPGVHCIYILFFLLNCFYSKSYHTSIHLQIKYRYVYYIMMQVGLSLLLTFNIMSCLYLTVCIHCNYVQVALLLIFGSDIVLSWAFIILFLMDTVIVMGS